MKLYGASNPAAFRNLFKDFGIEQSLPFGSIIKKWGIQKDHSFWLAAKAIPIVMIMAGMRSGVHRIVTTEEANVCKDYGSANAKVIGKKAKVVLSDP